MLRSENARPAGYVYIDLRGRDLGSTVRELQREVAAQVKLPPGYSLAWSGQFELLERATARLQLVVPFTLLIIFVLLSARGRASGRAWESVRTTPRAASMPARCEPSAALIGEFMRAV